MPRVSNKSKQPASSSLSPTESDYKFLMQRAEESGILNYMEMTASTWKPYRTLFGKWFREVSGNAHASKLDEDFVVMRETIAEVCKQHLFWFAKWMTMPQDDHRLQKIHYVVCDFLERGLDALPEEWLGVGEFFDRRRFYKKTDHLGFERRIDINPQIIMIPRDTGKSHVFTFLDAIRNVAIFPTSKWNIGQATLPLAQKQLGSIKKLVTLRQLRILFPEVYADAKTEYVSRGGKWTTNEVDVVTMADDLSDVRQEYTFMAVSIGSATTGSHPDGGFYDDLDNEDTTKTHSASLDAEQFWRNQTALAHTFGCFPKRLTDTFWYDGGICQRLKMESTYFRMPSDWVRDNKRIFLMPKWDEILIDGFKRESGIFGDAHCCIAPVPRDGLREMLGFDATEGGNVVTMKPEEIEEIRRDSIIVTVGDPAYVETGKKIGDARSRATVLHMMRNAEGKCWIFDVWQTTGLTLERWHERVAYECRTKNSDLFIQDAQGTQFTHFSDADKAVKAATENRCRTMMHTKRMGNKMQVAVEILKESFNSKEIMVIRDINNPQKIQPVIDQLCGLNQGMDIIDCLVYGMVDIDISVEYPCTLAHRSFIDRRKKSVDQPFSWRKKPLIIGS